MRRGREPGQGATVTAAEPDRTPPVPGAYVEVTDAHEPDSDVLYAFPPAARHHARGTS